MKHKASLVEEALMTAITPYPKLWVGNSDSAGSSQCSGGAGACPTPTEFDALRFRPVVRQLTNGHVQNVSLSGDVHLDRVDNHTLAISATGAHLIVLDHQASSLFSHLDGLTSVYSLSQAVAWPRAVVEQVVGLLLANGILTSPEYDSPNFVLDDSTTLTAWLHLANGCNLSCHYCFVSLNGRRMNTTTAVRAVESVYRSAIANGYSHVKLKYAGGEPTLNFLALMAAQQRAEQLSSETNISLQTVILSNGVSLRDEQIDQLQAHNIEVTISLDGIAELNDIQRPFAGRNQNQHTYEHVSRTLERLLERGISPYISITITDKNIGGLPDVVEYLLDRGLAFNLNFYRAPDDSPVYTSLAFAPGALIAGLRAVYRLIERRFSDYNPRSNLSDVVNLRFPHLRACGVGRDYLVINYDGSVAKCQMDMAQPVATIDVADSLRLVRVDATGIQNLSIEEREVGACVWRYRCAGGCSRQTFMKTGRYNSKSPMCEVYEAILPEIVRLEGLRLMRYTEPWDFGLSAH